MERSDTFSGREWTRTETNGSGVRPAEEGDAWRFTNFPGVQGYTNAQVDDYRGAGSLNFRWEVGSRLALQARFSAGVDRLRGTAGFGFWNAPFGPGTGYAPRLPQAAWFFLASEPTNLPLAPLGTPGRGWFAATIDATRPRALVWAPLAPLVLLLNQLQGFRRRVWPLVRRSLAISFAGLDPDLTEWHEYRLRWEAERCIFIVDDEPILITPFTPQGPMGFVCWIDNQYLVATPRGKFRWGTLAQGEAQWLEIQNVRLERD